MYSSAPAGYDHDSPMDTGSPPTTYEQQQHPQQHNYNNVGSNQHNASSPSSSIQYLDYLVHGNEEQQLVMMELQHMFSLDKPTLLQIVDYFDKEIKAGLVDDRSSDLNMIPSFVTGNLEGQEEDNL